MDSVTAWKSIPWRLPICTRNHRNYYYSRPACTNQKSLDTGILPVYRTVTDTYGSVSTSVFELHARALHADVEYAERLEKEYDHGPSTHSKQTSSSRLIAAAFTASKQSKAGASMAATGTVASSGRAGSSVSDSREAEHMTKSLAELIGVLSTDADVAGTGGVVFLPI